MKGFKFAVFGYFFDGLTQYFVDPIARIFGPSDDNYPATGVQPFEGEPLTKEVEASEMA
jgi:hypothetical protein